MDEIKHSRRFAEIETLMGSYFRYHLVPVMTQTQTYLTEKQGEEMKKYSTSISGILGMMASAGQPLSDPYQTLKVTGEWNSKTTEDYIGMCKERILSSEEIQHAGIGLRPRLRLRGLPRGATDDRPSGKGTYAQVLGGLHHPQSG